jgi:hypothetical protein
MGFIFAAINFVSGDIHIGAGAAAITTPAVIITTKAAVTAKATVTAGGAARNDAQYRDTAKEQRFAGFLAHKELLFCVW